MFNLFSQQQKNVFYLPVQKNESIVIEKKEIFLSFDKAIKYFLCLDALNYYLREQEAKQNKIELSDKEARHYVVNAMLCFFSNKDINTNGDFWVNYAEPLENFVVDCNLKQKQNKDEKTAREKISERNKELRERFPDMVLMDEEEEIRQENRIDAPIIDFEQDAGAIYASFMQAYNIDLLKEIGFLHWENFLQLLINLPDDTKLKQIQRIRLYNEADEKKTEKQQMRELKKHYKIKKYAEYLDKIKKIEGVEEDERTSNDSR